MYCGNCGARLAEDATVCEACGAWAMRTAAPVGTAESEILPLLAAANLSRIRRQWEDSTAKCIEVLRRYPNSAAAHSLLGDIYADQGLLRDAIEWYKLALELDPRNQGDRVKLDRLLKQVYGETQPAPAESPEEKEATGIFRFLRSAQLSRPILAAMIVGLLGIVVGVSAFVILSRQRTGGTLKKSTTAAGAVASRTSPKSNASRESLQRMESRADQAYAPVVPPPPVQPPSPGTLLSRQEQLVTHLRTMASEMPGRFTVESVSIDPRSYYCTVGFHTVAAETPGQTKAELLRIGWLIARAAFQRDNSLPRITLRGQTILDLGADMKIPELAMVADVEPATMASVGSRLPSSQEILTLMKRVWWHPSLEHIPV